MDISDSFASQTTGSCGRVATRAERRFLREDDLLVLVEMAARFRGWLDGRTSDIVPGFSKRGFSKRGFSKRGLFKHGFSKRGFSKRFCFGDLAEECIVAVGVGQAKAGALLDAIGRL